MHFLGEKRPYDATGLYDPTFTTAVCQSDDRLRCAGTLSERGCSTARPYAPVDDHALPVGRFLDGYQSEALREGVKLGRPKIDRTTERRVRKELAKGMGMLKVAKWAGVAVSSPCWRRNRSILTARLPPPRMHPVINLRRTQHFSAARYESAPDPHLHGPRPLDGVGGRLRRLR